MKFEIDPVGKRYGEDDKVVLVDRDWKALKVSSEEDVTFAVVICMTCESHKSDLKKVLVVPNITDHDEAYEKARVQHKLSGEWSTDVGVSLFKSNVEFKVPRTWEECEVQYLNDERQD